MVLARLGQPASYSMQIQIYYSKNEWGQDLKEITNKLPGEVELLFQSRVFDEKKETIPWWRMFTFERPLAVGAPGLEGIIPLLAEGIDIVLNNPFRDTIPYKIIELWALYEFVEGKLRQLPRIFQIATDYIVAEAGETPQDHKSVTFIWPPNLSKEEFKKSLEGATATRNSILNDLKNTNESVNRQINHIECFYIEGSWKINVVKKSEFPNDQPTTQPRFFTLEE